MKTITIVGGGLAGLALGIGLRRSSVPVVVIEAGHYPRHRVCGEFISGRGQEVLARLEVAALVQRYSRPAETSRFCVARYASPVRRLQRAAWCISRYILDEMLSRELQRMGGELRTGVRWQNEAAEPGIVRATGRRPQRVDTGWRWFGLKLHARGVSLSADLEMHRVPQGYVGLCRLQNDVVNVCGLFRRSIEGHTPIPDRTEALLGAEGSLLRERLCHSEQDDTSRCAVGGLDLAGRLPRNTNALCIGDALTMIPPITGNGMSMALESAALAQPQLERYSRGTLSWGEACELTYASAKRAFSSRLRWGCWLHRLACNPFLQGPRAVPMLNSGLLWRWLFERTR